MKCVIIEDEQNAVEHLEYLLGKCDYRVTIEAKLDSVKSALLWLKQNKTDLIFLDVQLGDGISFSIFENIELDTPVIFTTSYDQYALEAFRLNSIAYLLKPIDLDELNKALSKYHNLFDRKNYEQLSRLSGTYQKRFMVQSGNTILSIRYEDIAYFYTESRHVFIVTQEGSQYLFEGTLEALETRLDPETFFRINRQFIVGINAIQKMYTETRGRVKIEIQPPAKEELIVSIDRANEFKNWLNR